jgi:hypothetical protein
VGEASSGGMAVGRVAVVWAGESDWLVFLDGERVDLDVGDGEVGTTGDDGVQTICLLDGKGREPAFYGSSEATKEGYQCQRLFDDGRGIEATHMILIVRVATIRRTVKAMSTERLLIIIMARKTI